EAVVDGGEDIARHPAEIAVDQQIVAAVEDRQIGRALTLMGGGAGLVAVGGVADLPRLEVEQAHITRDGRDGRVLPMRRSGDPGDERVDLVAGVFGVIGVAGLGQRIPDGCAGQRRLGIEQPGSAGDAGLGEGDGDIAVHEACFPIAPRWQGAGDPGYGWAVPGSSARTCAQIAKASSIWDRLTTSGGIIRTTFMCAPQVSSSSPFWTASCCAAVAVSRSGSPAAVTNSAP